MMSYPYPLPYPQHVADLGRRPSFLATARSIHSVHGLPGFFRGLGPSFLRAFPVNASAMFVYEGLLRILGAEKVCVMISPTPCSSYVPYCRPDIHECGTVLQTECLLDLNRQPPFVYLASINRNFSRLLPSEDRPRIWGLWKISIAWSTWLNSIGFTWLSEVQQRSLSCTSLCLAVQPRVLGSRRVKEVRWFIKF